MAPALRTHRDGPETPQRNLFSAFQSVPSTAFAGETPFRSSKFNLASSVDSPVDSHSSGMYSANDDSGAEDGEGDDDDYDDGEYVEDDEIGEEEDGAYEDEEGEEEGVEQDAESEIEEPQDSPQKPVDNTGSFSLANIAKKGIPCGGIYSFDASPTFPNGNYEREEQHKSTTARECGRSPKQFDEKLEYEEEDTMRDEQAEGESLPPSKNHIKPPVSQQEFLASNPHALLRHCKELLNSAIVNLYPQDSDLGEQGLPYSKEESPQHPHRSARERAGTIAKVVRIFLNREYFCTEASADALYVSSLLLNLHHPTPQVPKGVIPSQLEIYKSWLDKNHPNPTADDLQILHTYHPTPCASPDYWEIITHLALRGELEEVHDLLNRGGWSNIQSEPTSLVISQLDRGYKYTREEVSVIQRVLNAASKLISSCPQLFSNVAGGVGSAMEHERYSEWRIFRRNVIAAVEELKTLSHSHAEEENNGVPAEDVFEYRYEQVTTTRGGFQRQTLQKVAVPKSNRNLNLRGFKQKETKLPYDVEAGLKNLFTIIGGKFDEILAASERWEEAVLAVSIWRRYMDDDDDDDDVSMGDMFEETGFGQIWGASTLLGRGGLRTKSSRTTVRKLRSQQRGTATAMESGLEVLKSAFRKVTTNDLLIDTTSPKETALAAVLQGDWRGVVDTLISKEWAAYGVAEFTIELARLGNWSIDDCDFGDGSGAVGLNSLLDVFRDDWSVFQSAQNIPTDGKEKRRKWEEKIVDACVKCLVNVGKLEAPSLPRESFTMDIDDAPKKEAEGWELGMQVLSRWRSIYAPESTEWIRNLAGSILTKIPYTSPSTVDKILEYCGRWELTTEASTISTAFADRLFERSQYGDALIYYSRSRSREKIHSILTRFLKKSLLLSAPYPSITQLDDTFKKILDAPTPDEDGILRYELSGYAALRRFYEARDCGDLDTASKTIVALIRSAGEMIDGGRLDEEWESPVEWWVLGVLIGECLKFLNQPTAFFPLRSIFDILKALQDLCSSGSSALRATEEFLHKSLQAYERPIDIPLLLKPKRSSDDDMGGSSIFGFGSGSWERSAMLIDKQGEEIISESVIRQRIEDEEFSEGYVASGEMEKDQKRKRWDWREGITKIMEKEGNASGAGLSSRANGGAGCGRLETVIRIARMGFSKEIARRWLQGEES